VRPNAGATKALAPDDEDIVSLGPGTARIAHKIALDSGNLYEIPPHGQKPAELFNHWAIAPFGDNPQGFENAQEVRRTRQSPAS
jgi:hypothetical protein